MNTSEEPKETVREVIAQAIATQHVAETDAMNEPPWASQPGAWLKCSDAILSALSQKGFVIVPRGPSDAMMSAGTSRYADCHGATSTQYLITQVWLEMLQASQNNTEK